MARISRAAPSARRPPCGARPAAWACPNSMSSSRSTSVTPGRNAHSAGDMGMAGRNSAAAAGAGFTSAGGRSKVRTASTVTTRTASSAAVSASCPSRKRSTIRRSSDAATMNGQMGAPFRGAHSAESGRVQNAEQSAAARCERQLAEAEEPEKGPLECHPQAPSGARPSTRRRDVGQEQRQRDRHQCAVRPW